MNWYQIKAQSEEIAEVWIYDVVGEDFFGDGVSAKGFVEELNDISASTINLHINSPGGSVRDGQAIHNALVRHPAKVTTYVDGLAASIASTIALAGDEVIMADNSLMMIHSAWAVTMGNATEMRHTADILEKHDQAIEGIYARKTGKDLEEIQSAMAAETWFTAQEAVDFGLADRVEDGLKAVALTITPEILARFKNAPEDILDRQPDSTLTTTDAIDPVFIQAAVPVGATEDITDGASEVTLTNVFDFDLEKIRHRRNK